MSEWQPIETAPKDGNAFLATDGVRHMLAAWSFSRQTTTKKTTRRAFFQKEIVSETTRTDEFGWFAIYSHETDEDGHWYGGQFRAKGLTHWMPLPAPPARLEGEAA